MVAANSEGIHIPATFTTEFIAKKLMNLTSEMGFHSEMDGIYLTTYQIPINLLKSMV